jgi:hypothetical protein
MNKEILQEILSQLTTILSKDEFIRIIPDYDYSKTSEQNRKIRNKAVNEHSKKYKAIEDLINKL